MILMRSRTKLCFAKEEKVPTVEKKIDQEEVIAVK